MRRSLDRPLVRRCVRGPHLVTAFIVSRVQTANVAQDAPRETARSVSPPLLLSLSLSPDLPSHSFFSTRDHLLVVRARDALFSRKRRLSGVLAGGSEFPREKRERKRSVLAGKFSLNSSLNSMRRLSLRIARTNALYRLLRYLSCEISTVTII